MLPSVVPWRMIVAVVVEAARGRRVVFVVSFLSFHRG